MTLPRQDQEVRGAKKKAIENAEKTWALAERQRNLVDTDSNSFDDGIGAPLMVNKQDDEPSGTDSDEAQPRDKPSRDSLVTDSEGNESVTGSENEDSAAMRLFDEVASVVTNKQGASKSCGTSKLEFACDHKQVAESPKWANMDLEDTVSESIEDPSTGGDSSEFHSDNEGTAPKLTSDAQTSKTRSIASLVRTDGGKVKLLDQNLETRKVLQSAIMEVKCHLFFTNSYPELVDKNQVALEALIVVAENRGVHAIKECLQSDERYASQLGSLINNEASPIGKKPYQGELLIYLIYRQLFHSSRSIAVKFMECFVKITNNKGQRPEVPIPLLALVATAVYAALMWKLQGSTSKFNFTGNLFSETYNYHVRFLKKLNKDVPAKFHCMMADIYEAAQKLRYSGTAASGHGAELEAFELLDLDNMEED
ncbi:hypothetical protein DFJ58DRAFT_849007 [Suillus subalutaceus]|uniref:uncharacterized protein n=1 Tax=Suillus subalutaceus TaxID=48586 RepID=UPI001B881CE2|nr:uncharacterized protein DFJ58DRAFT_849007 [Suillus subalutaceus]KAG1828594.1 hypothetical protein DFJ58DRAFT_849007 [Suillus subalutaceus]